jgi:hypothetical protein
MHQILTAQTQANVSKESMAQRCKNVNTQFAADYKNGMNIDA